MQSSTALLDRSLGQRHDYRFDEKVKAELVSVLAWVPAPVKPRSSSPVAEGAVIERILRHLGLWEQSERV